MKCCARRDNLDLIFIGGFSRHHAHRIAALKAAASTPGIRARLHNLFNHDLHSAFQEIERVGRGAKYICVEALATSARE